MKKYLLLIVLVCISILYSKVSRAQEKAPVVDKIINFPTTFFNKVQNKYANLEDRVTKQTTKYLQRLAKKEKKMKRKLARVDSAKAEQTFGDIDAQYGKMIAAMAPDLFDFFRDNYAIVTVSTVDKVTVSTPLMPSK
jgi:hypothetical protein